MASSLDAAQALASLVKDGTIDGKPVIAAWLGEATAGAAREQLEAAGIACHGDPGDAARTVAWLDDWSKARRLLRLLRQTVAVENIVPQHQGDGGAVDKCTRQNKRLGDALGTRLLDVLEAQAEMAAVTKQVAETRQVLGRGDDHRA